MKIINSTLILIAAMFSFQANAKISDHNEIEDTINHRLQMEIEKLNQDVYRNVEDKMEVRMIQLFDKLDDNKREIYGYNNDYL